MDLKFIMNTILHISMLWKCPKMTLTAICLPTYFSIIQLMLPQANKDKIAYEGKIGVMKMPL